MEQGSRGHVAQVLVNGERCVKKTSRLVDVTIEMESEALSQINGLHSPHFPRLTKWNLDKRVPEMFIEFIDGKPLSQHDGNFYSLKSLIGRSLTAAAIMNEKLGIVHNDLHRSNIMVRKTLIDIDRYVFDDGEVLEFETHGFEPVIIDFGLANSNSPTMNLTTAFTDIGFFPFQPDQLA